MLLGFRSLVAEAASVPGVSSDGEGALLVRLTPPLVFLFQNGRFSRESK